MVTLLDPPDAFWSLRPGSCFTSGVYEPSPARSELACICQLLHVRLRFGLRIRSSAAQPSGARQVVTRFWILRTRCAQRAHFAPRPAARLGRRAMHRWPAACCGRSPARRRPWSGSSVAWPTISCTARGVAPCSRASVTNDTRSAWRSTLPPGSAPAIPARRQQA